MGLFTLLTLFPSCTPDATEKDPGGLHDTGDSDTGDTGRDDTDTGGDDTSEPDTGGDDTAEPDTADTDTGDDTAGDTGEDDTAEDDTAEDDTAEDDTAEDDTADTDPSACTPADLVLTAEVRDASGTAGTSWATSDSLTMTAVLSNPCTTDVTFDTPDSCLFTGADVAGSSGLGTGVAVACASVITTWTVPASSSLEESYAWGRLRADSYVLSVYDNLGNAASQAFSVM